MSVQHRFALEEFSRYMKPSDVEARVRQLAISDKEHTAIYELFVRAVDRMESTGVSSYPQNLGDWVTLADK